MNPTSPPQISRLLQQLGLASLVEPGSLFESALAGAAANLAKAVPSRNLDDIVGYALRSGTQVAGAADVQRRIAESDKKTMIAGRIAPTGETA